MSRLLAILMSLCVLTQPTAAFAQPPAGGPPARPNGTNIYLLTQQALPPELENQELRTCFRRPPGGPDAAAFIPLLLFVANLVLQEGLEALSRSEARRLESYSNSYGARLNMAAFPRLADRSPPSSGETSCLVVERRDEGALASLFVFELRPMTASAFTVRPILAHIARSPVTVRSRVQTINTNVMLGFNAIVPGNCRAGEECARSTLTLGAPSVSIRGMTVGQTLRACDLDPAPTPGCAKLEGPSALLIHPGAAAPTTVAATVAETSSALADARIQNAIWERQRVNLLAALNKVLANATD